jgi:ABC-type spermidine/putrescine transport system, permease component II
MSLGRDDTSGVTTNGSLSARFGRLGVVAVLAVVLVFLVVPIVVTIVSSFATSATGLVPSNVASLLEVRLDGWTVDNWARVLGYTDFGVQEDVPATLIFSMQLATGGMVANILIGVPIAYALTRYDFFAREWLNALAILPLVPGVILGIAFIRAYPESASSWFGLIAGYALLKSPFMVLTVQSSFQSMDLRQLEESARSLGASWPRAFLTVIVPNAKNGIVAGSIICWTLAAAEFNFTYMVYSTGPEPFAMFLYRNITNASFLQQAAAISVYFVIVVAAIVLLQLLGNAGFTTTTKE